MEWKTVGLCFIFKTSQPKLFQGNTDIQWTEREWSNLSQKHAKPANQVWGCTPKQSSDWIEKEIKSFKTYAAEAYASNSKTSEVCKTIPWAVLETSVMKLKSADDAFSMRFCCWNLVLQWYPKAGWAAGTHLPAQFSCTVEPLMRSSHSTQSVTEKGRKIGWNWAKYC